MNYEVSIDKLYDVDVKNVINETGFLVIRGFFSEEDLKPIWKDLDHFAQAFYDMYGLHPVDVPADERERLLVSLIQQNPQSQSLIYNRLQQMPSLLAVPNHAKVRKLAQYLLDTENWGVWPRVQVRLDLHEDAVNLIEWHHDYLYNKGTTSSYTFWLPITSVTPDMGGLEIANRSHLAENVEFVEVAGPNRYKYTLDDETLKQFEIIKADTFNAGDLVVFHSLVLHTGLLNSSKDRARLTGLFRMQNLNDLELENA